MKERILATGIVKQRIRSELETYREQHALYVKKEHPLISFVTLEMLAHDPRYTKLVSQPLLCDAFEYLVQRLEKYEECHLLDPTRVWVGIQTSPHADFFGGFYHSNQGYRYIQQVAIVSLSGSLSSCSVDPTLATLELIRSYIHDTLHHNSYRLFVPTTSGKDGSFYRLQYGINFRKWDGRTYSAKDSVRATTTRNLGNIMEAAADRFAHELVAFLANTIHYHPDSSLIEDYIFRDCTGQLSPADMLHLRNIEKGLARTDAPTAFQTYLKNMRLFVQYVTMRYRSFLEEFDPMGIHSLHALVVSCMLSGKLKKLCRTLDEIQTVEQSFVKLFKASDYTDGPHIQV